MRRQEVEEQIHYCKQLVMSKVNVTLRERGSKPEGAAPSCGQTVFLSLPSCHAMKSLLTSGNPSNKRF
ncbi:hypothetical protein EYF80_019503 [Liparis tanakae]|uniref:Uncharacterized protein n=1 Tax=Liparis tanakae TaxID=230148 RepID=A0A4Z2HWU0_9TELE|nr:hypothetical protein EYF80_019503 [Liparis tanakae]